MLPEWGRFVTAVKLNKGLKDSNFDQLYAYLKQHEAHANENKMMLERLTQQTVDPLALMSNVSPQHYQSQSINISHRPHINNPFCRHPQSAGVHDNAIDEDVERTGSRLSSQCGLKRFQADDL
ncbi:hypothetical protein Tco_0860729 [Tanacetum coccineum]|uniref:Integrase, catalytic region, zinc finger, CCHC-type, peptidase aspartic, catalytic n=1 Tax=Tanacetum coccineum TaxID=301880 RepID=A0ABQ5BIQ7_9ASTR